MPNHPITSPVSFRSTAQLMPSGLECWPAARHSSNHVRRCSSFQDLKCICSIASVSESTALSAAQSSGRKARSISRGVSRVGEAIVRSVLSDWAASTYTSQQPGSASTALRSWPCGRCSLAAFPHQPVDRWHAIGRIPKAAEHLGIGKFHEGHDLEIMSDQGRD